MMSVGTVNGCKGKFEEAIGKVQPKFEELKSSWEGDSYDSLKSKVASMVAEVKVISSQFDNLATVADCYFKYEEEGKKYQEFDRCRKDCEKQLYDENLSEEDKDRARRMREYYLTLMNECKEKMKKIVENARSACSAGIGVEVNAVAFKPVESV